MMEEQATQEKIASAKLLREQYAKRLAELAVEEQQVDDKLAYIQKGLMEK